MPRPLHRRVSDISTTSDGEADYYPRPPRPRHTSPVSRGRRAVSLSTGKRPGLDQKHSYRLPSRSRERQYYSHDDRGDDSAGDSSSSSSGSDDDRRYRRGRNDGRSRSRLGRKPTRSRGTRSPSPEVGGAYRSRSVDNHHRSRHSRHHDDEESSSRRHHASAAPRISHRPDRDRDHDRGRRYPPSASRSKHIPSSPSPRDRDRSHSSSSRRNTSAPPRPKRSGSDILISAGRSAFEAGAVAALKLRSDPGPWIGAKGAKIATAALSAAAVDTYMEQKQPKHKGGLRHTMMRQGMQLAIGNLVMKPAAGRAEKGKERVKGKVGARMGRR